MSAIRNKLLVLNAGSSSLKYKLFQLGENSALKAVASGVCERIGDAAASFHRVSDRTALLDPPVAPPHRVGLQLTGRHYRCRQRGGTAALAGTGTVQWGRRRQPAARTEVGWSSCQAVVQANHCRCAPQALPSPPASHPLPATSLQGKAGGGEQRQEAPLPNHTAALELVSKFLGDSFKGVSS